VKIQFGQECFTSKGSLLDKGRWIITAGAFASMSSLGMSRTSFGTEHPADLAVTIHWGRSITLNEKHQVEGPPGQQDLRQKQTPNSCLFSLWIKKKQ